MKLLHMPRRDGALTESNVLPQVWATDGNLAHAVHVMAASQAPEETVNASAVAEAPAANVVFQKVLAPNVAFYRSYTEAMLRRFGVLSMESGRVPSLLGREMFRGKVTHYKVQAFDDVVIFCHDVQRCIAQLTPEQQRLIARIGVQEYTLPEAAAMFGLTLRSVSRRYFQAVDELTSLFLKRRLLERIASDPCQEGGGGVKIVSHTPDESYG